MAPESSLWTHMHLPPALSEHAMTQVDHLSDFPSSVVGQIYCAGDEVSAADILGPEYLSFDLDDPTERRWLGAYALARLADRAGVFVPVGEFRSAYSIVVAGRRFGRGSARVHSAVALAEAGVRAVVAESISGEFMRAATNAGLLLCLTFGAPGSWTRLRTGDQGVVDLEEPALRVGDERLALHPPGVVREIVESGGLAATLRAGSVDQPAARPR